MAYSFRVFALGLMLVAGQVCAQDRFDADGYLIACGEEGCFVNAAGMELFVPADQGAEQLADLPMMAAVHVTGALSQMGDSSANLALGSVSRRGDDLYEGNLLAMQGDWKPLDEEAPFHIGIYGMDWTEVLNDEEDGRFMMSVGDACADGTVQTGMVLSLYRYGDDPGADACWLLEYIDDTRMTLRDVGTGAAVDFVRLVE